MTSKLFEPLSVGRMELANRVTIAAMCQYSAVEGSMTDWHMQHLGNLALSGASMLPIERPACCRKAHHALLHGSLFERQRSGDEARRRFRSARSRRSGSASS
jgi:2,4-dienoyl-CoA reductase-like NADH-dependent reductase (Old Yellow Enzyme family)